MCIYKPKELRLCSQTFTDNLCDPGSVPCPSCIPFCYLLSAACCETWLKPPMDYKFLDCKYNNCWEKKCNFLRCILQNHGMNVFMALPLSQHDLLIYWSTEDHFWQVEASLWAILICWSLAKLCSSLGSKKLHTLSCVWKFSDLESEHFLEEQLLTARDYLALLTDFHCPPDSSLQRPDWTKEF